MSVWLPCAIVPAGDGPFVLAVFLVVFKFSCPTFASVRLFRSPRSQSPHLLHVRLPKHKFGIHHFRTRIHF